MRSGLSIVFRLLLLLVSLGTMAFFLHKIRKAKIQIHDVIFWILFSCILIVLIVFPDVLTFFSRLLGIESPANLLFLVIIFLLLIQQFALTIKISMLENNLNQFGRQYALEKREETDDN